MYCPKAMIKELRTFDLFHADENEEESKINYDRSNLYIPYKRNVISNVPQILGFMYNKYVAELKMMYCGESLQ